MRKMKVVALVAGVGLLLGSCMSSNNVVNNKLISKRKYTKGFFINGKGSFKSDKSDETQDLAYSKDVNEVTRDLDLRELNTRDVASVQISDEKTLIRINKSVQAKKELNVQEISSSKGNDISKAEKTELVDGKYKKDEVKQVNDKQISKAPTPADDTAMLILLVILAIIIPPVAVAVYEGITTRFWIDLLLALIGWGLGYWLLGPGIAFIGGLAAIIYALLIVLGAI